jgi:hypothetical protein
MSVVEEFTPAPGYVIAGTGPYRVPHAYLSADTLSAFVVGSDGAAVTLSASDWSVMPSSAYTQGDLMLSESASATHAGATLYIVRDTS